MTIDSNIVIAFVGGEEKVVAQLSDWKKSGRLLFLSTIAEAEVLGFPGFSAAERQETAHFIANHFVPILCDRAVAFGAAQLRGSVNIKLADALIAATALMTGTPLVTRNVRDFKKVPGLEVVAL